MLDKSAGCVAGAKPEKGSFEPGAPKPAMVPDCPPICVSGDFGFEAVLGFDGPTVSLPKLELGTLLSLKFEADPDLFEPQFVNERVINVKSVMLNRRCLIINAPCPVNCLPIGVCNQDTDMRLRLGQWKKERYTVKDPYRRPRDLQSFGGKPTPRGLF